MRVVVLYTRLSSYMAACLREFRIQTDAELLIYAKPSQPNAPFSGNSFSGLDGILDRSTFSETEIENHVRAFRPDAILVSGWGDPAYSRICRKLKATGVPVIAGCDTQWKGSLRQRIATLVAPWHVQRFIDVLWVTGERQHRLARALGYRGEHCWEGYYACDWKAFAAKSEERNRKSKVGSNLQSPLSASNPSSAFHLPSSPSFLFVGRYVPEKGLNVLVKAYALYREKAEKLDSEDRAERAEASSQNLTSDLRPPASDSRPWNLICAGKGELAGLLTHPGIQDKGFVQPEHLPQLMYESSCFVLPSRFEPWGVVIQEAAASGLPLIVSRACGAGDHLVRDGQNGFVVETGNVQHLASAMMRMHRLSDDERREFGRRSFELSKQYAPVRWAKTLVEGIKQLKSRNAEMLKC